MKSVTTEKLQPGDIIYENNGYSVQVVVLTTPVERDPVDIKGTLLRQWSFTGRIAGGVIEFVNTPESAYALRLSWEPECVRMLRVDGSEKFG